MNREDIIRMAQEAGLWETRHSVEMAIGGVGELERFAALVASAEREACAKLRDTLHPFDLHNRSEMLGVMNQGLDDYQNLIRARGQE